MSSLNEFSQLGIRTQIEGKIVLPDQSTLRGTIKGELYAPVPSRVVFEKCSTFEGQARLDEAILHGFFEGDLHSNSQITLAASARFKGNIVCSSIRIEDGAILEGKVQTLEPKK